MSILPPSSSSDDPLAHAEAALRRAAVPEGPSAAIIARTLAAIHARAKSDRHPKPRRRIVLVTMKVAAAALIAAGGLSYFAGIPSAESAVFAEVAQKLQDANILAYRMTTESSDLIKAPLKMRVTFKEPNLFRTEVDGGMISIVDGKQGKQLLLNPASKDAMLLEGKSPTAFNSPANTSGVLERLRQLAEGDARLMGDKLIGEVQVRGYLVKNKTSGIEMTVWIDPGTRLPIRIESSDTIQGKEIHCVLSDFRIDPDVDEALFRLEPPAGYTLRKGESKALEMDEKTFLNPEQATADYLRIFAAKTGGTFPRQLDDLSEFDRTFPKKQKIGELPDAETLRVVHALTRFLMATRPLKGKFGYKSEGVKLGDADKILFWYRPDGATSYRAIFGDLHAADVAEDKLPEKATP